METIKTSVRTYAIVPRYLLLFFVPTLAFFLPYVALAAAPLIPLAIGAGVALDWALGWPAITALLQIIFAGLGTIFISATGFLAALSGAIFDALLKWTVVDFGGTLSRLGIADGINLVWTAFRDIANILIIGMFVFIAISIILGITRYGDKAMIARVLIVAVLINFSLLFTRIIIESSNLVSRVFYQESLSAIGQGSGKGADLTTTEGIQEANTASGGIALAFMVRAGIPSLWSWGSIFSQLFQSGRANNSAAIVFAFALASGTFLIIASLVFLFGAFLMASRAIMLIFLTVTSSLAFASYLIPQFSESQYGWKGWWDTLIKAAIFGPLLMILLWASLVLLRAPQGSANLAAFLQNPGDQNGWIAIVMFIFVIGFLYMSIKLASMFATNITGFSMAALAPALALGLGGRVAAFAGRRTFGWAASKTGKWAEGRAGKIGDRLAGKPGYEKGEGLQSRMTANLKKGAYDIVAQKLKGPRGVTTRDFNIAHTVLGREIQKIAQFKKPEKTFTGPDTKGYEGAEKRAAERYAREGERVAMTKTDQEAFKKNVREAMLAGNAPLADQKAFKKNVREAVLAGNAPLADQKRESDERLVASNTELARATNTSIEHTQRVAKSAKELRDTQRTFEDLQIAGAPQAAVNAAENARNSKRAEYDRHNLALGQEQSRIKQARDSITRDTKIQEAILRKLDDIAQQEGRLPKEFATAQQAAFESARGRYTNVLREKVGLPLAAEDDSLAKQSAEAVKTLRQDKNFGRITDLLRRRMSESSPVPPPRAPGGP